MKRIINIKTVLISALQGYGVSVGLENAGNLVITFESRLLKDHDDNKRNVEIFLQSDSTISAFETVPKV